MRIPQSEFLEKFKALYFAKAPYIAIFAYWKMEHLIQDGETFYLPEYDCYYLIRDKHLLIYYSPDHQMHLSAEALNALDCISLPGKLYDAIKDQLEGFVESRAWSFRYDFHYTPPRNPLNKYETVDFDFDNPYHYKKAAEVINQGSGWMTDKNIKKMTQYSAFDPSLWFFVKDTTSGELVAISISQYHEEVRQTDLDWIYVLPSHHGQGAGRFLIEQTIARCKSKSDDICVGGTVEFYRKCGFYDHELWVWAPKKGYQFKAPAIQP